MKAEIKVGSVVLVTAGKEKGLLFAVIGFSDDERLIISDGRTRKLNKPKTKSAKHIAKTGVLLEKSSFRSNCELHRAIKAVNQQV